MEEFKIGDVVVLKSGGPRMTVTNPDFGEDHEVQCCWFESGKIHYGIFPPSALTSGSGGGGFAVA